MTNQLTTNGISTVVPDGWDGRIMGGTGSTHNANGFPLRSREYGSPDGSGGINFPIIHLGNFALPPNRGDYGSGAVDIMSSRNILIVLSEFGPESVGTALFAPRGLPRSLTPQPFSPNALQRKLPGQLGFQHFFTEAGRAFSLFIVLGGSRYVADLCSQGTKILSSTRIESR